MMSKNYGSNASRNNRGGTTDQEQSEKQFPPFPDTTNVLETENWIYAIRQKFIPYRFNYTGEKDPDIPPTLVSTLKTFLERGKASYFLNDRLRELLSDLEEGTHRGEENDSLPYQIAPGVFGSYVDGRGLYITHSKESFDNINAWLASVGQTEEVYEERKAELARLAALPDEESDPDGYTEDHYLTQDAMAEYSFQESIFPNNFTQLQSSDLVFSQSENSSVDLADLATLHSGGMLWNVENDFGIKLKEVSLPIQYNFLQFVKQKTKDESLPVQEFTKKFKTAGLTTFLAQEQDTTWGERIIALSNILTQEQGEKLFGKFSEIVNASSRLAPLIAELFKDDTLAGEKLAPRIYVHLLQRATGLLQTAEEKLNGGNTEALLTELEHTQSDLLLFAAVCREARNDISLSIEDVLATHVERKTGAELSGGETNGERGEMLRIFKSNWSHKSSGTRKEITDAFISALSDQRQEFYLLRDTSPAGHIAAFVRFTTLPNGHRYAGSFNTSPAVRGYKLGPMLFDTLLNREAESTPVEAMSMLDQPMLRAYLMHNKFILTGLSQGNTESQFTMLRDDSLRAKLIGPKLTDAELDAAIHAGLTEGYTLVPFNQKEPDPKTLVRYFASGQIVSRWYVRGSGESYLLFEPRPEDQLALAA